jgi:uncharacterized membrane protein YdbT with pleckstrin-like domain
MEGEEVIHEILPEPKKVARYLNYIVNGIGFLSFSCWAPIALVAPLGENGIIRSVGLGILVYVGAMLASQLLFWIFATPFVVMASKKYRYWATNRRIVTRTGIIGYKISSIPLERVSDVTVSHNVLALLIRAPVLVIRDMAANAHWRGPRWIGVPEAETVQHDILEAVNQANKNRGRL